MTESTPDQVKNTYEMTLKTGESQVGATSARAFLTLIDVDGRQEERQLIPKRGFPPNLRPGQVRSCIINGI